MKRFLFSVLAAAFLAAWVPDLFLTPGEATAQTLPARAALTYHTQPSLSLALPQQKPAVKPAPMQHKHATGYKPLTPAKKAYYKALDKARHGQRILHASKVITFPASFDCRVKSPLPIWDQGSCGSCYLVSTVRTMTDAGVMAGFGKPDGSFKMAAQYGMDSPRNFGGCNGGNGTEVIDWATKNGWIAETWIDTAGTVHNDYPPYEATEGSDRTAPGAKKWVQGWTWGLVSNTSDTPSVDEIKAAMFLHGRLNVSLDAGGQFGSGTDTITSLGSSIDHEINMIAWDDNKDGGAFLLENQWGNAWGTAGCRWVTYKAAQNIVGHFWVSAGVIPPPPPVPPQPPPVPPVPPPVPPGPVPGGLVASATLTYADGSTQQLISTALQRSIVSFTYSDGTVVPVGVTKVTYSDGSEQSVAPPHKMHKAAPAPDPFRPDKAADWRPQGTRDMPAKGKKHFVAVYATPSAAFKAVAGNASMWAKLEAKGHSFSILSTTEPDGRTYIDLLTKQALAGKLKMPRAPFLLIIDPAVASGDNSRVLPFPTSTAKLLAVAAGKKGK